MYSILGMTKCILYYVYRVHSNVTIIAWLAPSEPLFFSIFFFDFCVLPKGGSRAAGPRQELK